ncbi:MAG TPA: hypothetical protein VFY13_07450 [Luteolibacter sp.]|nr:hypothetical protein [Luteolibacter sp.]
MSVNFSIRRILPLLALLILFAICGGFSPWTPAPDAMIEPTRLTKGWFYCVLMFLSGAVSATLIDHEVGSLDRTSLRSLYVILGVLLMLGSGFWMYSLRDAVEG